MPESPTAPGLERWLGEVLVFDLAAPYVCIGQLVSIDGGYLRVLDADLHDFRDSVVTRENYVYDSVRLGIRRNRVEVLLRASEVVAITKFSAISES